MKCVSTSQDANVIGSQEEWWRHHPSPLVYSRCPFSRCCWKEINLLHLCRGLGQFHTSILVFSNKWHKLPSHLEYLAGPGWRRQWHPTPVLLPGKSHGWRSLVGCSPWGRWGSDTTERLHFHFSLSCTGEGNGNPLQCSCLENPRDGGAWWAAVYRVAQSRTQLKRLNSSSSSPSLKTLSPHTVTFWALEVGTTTVNFEGSWQRVTCVLCILWQALN